ncbi:uncharacterized protein LOC124207758 isoform X2 [Daphnia pulex]|uniref:uncharacterized protein LOC124207758 isoform X2 n=1 Tax=Daphnia pulex TaxID=6669 RepID=UPI001EDE0FD2|nr:uncharacterized protein LOC124207758 isoform X2 [Daphnia pulex]
MKSLLTFVLVFCLAIIAVEAQTKTTAKGQVTSTKPKLTTVKSTLRTTTRIKLTTTRRPTTRPTTRPTSRPTTRNPITTTAATTIKSFKVCQDTNSAAASGSIQPLDGLKPVATGSPRTCSFSIVVPSNQQVQMSCSVAKLTPITTVLDNAGGIEIVSSSLTFDGTLDLQSLYNVVPNRVYTSYSNAMTVTYRVVNAADTFNCNWTTIPTTTTDFKWCRDGETTAANGSIQTLREPVGNGNANAGIRKACPFFINSSPNRQVQTSCSFITSTNFALSTTSYFRQNWLFQPKFNKTTANSNQVDLLMFYQATDTDSAINCNWMTATPTTATRDFNNCLNVKSTTTNGTISPALVNTNELKTCLFSIFVPLGQRIQMTCNYNSTNVVISSGSILRLSETAQIATSRLPSLLLSTSINNRLDVFASYVKGDKFLCGWTTITIPPTKDFKVCRDGETTVASGTISPLENTNTTIFGGVCRFIITAPANVRVQMSCPFINQFTNILLYEYDTYISYITNKPVVNQIYTSKGNQLFLDLDLSGFAGTIWFNCTWTFV